jgi:pyruvate,water dikinase
MTENIAWFGDFGIYDVPRFGGKNASLSEMQRTLRNEGVRVPDGFATSVAVYRSYVTENRLADPLRRELDLFDSGRQTLAEAGAHIRRLFLDAYFPESVAAEIRAAYEELCTKSGVKDVAVAVRSSATAEDLPGASFAGQQETFLNVRGARALIDACRRCFASLFTDRAITYRNEMRFDHFQVGLSIGVQRMVRSDLAGSGVIFTIDTDSGFPGVVLISAAWGLGETVVQGTVEPDRFLVFKPLLVDGRYRPIIEKTCGAKEAKLVYAEGGSARTKLLGTTPGEREALVLSDDEVLQLARWALVIENHYGCAMDIEWAKDGETSEIFIVQARPETGQSAKRQDLLTTFVLTEKGRRLASGSAIGQSIVTGEACILKSAEDIARFRPGAILVTETTDPDWVPIMKQARGIVSDHGGPTSHAAIVSRELGVPALVGTGNATQALRDGQPITLSCAEGERGYVYDGALAFEKHEARLDDLPKTRTAMMINIASPAAAFQWWRLPVQGVGLARMEFIISNVVKAHPMSLVHPECVEDGETRRLIRKLTRGYAHPSDYFVDVLALGVAKIAAPFHPHPVILRLSDFKTNEYAHLLGGAAFEPSEENPMLGFRGASRYYDPRYREGFALECRAIRKVRDEIGFKNLIVMIPFCRTVSEADKVLAVMAEHGLVRGVDGLQLYMMCEIPANVILAEKFATRFDGFSIGSNDLTQLVLGVERDSGDLTARFDERDEAVMTFIVEAIEKAHRAGIKIGICGQAPSNYPEFAAFLVAHHIDSISLNPDSFIPTVRAVAAAEAGSPAMASSQLKSATA